SHDRLPGSHHRERLKGMTPFQQLAISAERDVEARAVCAEIPDHRHLFSVRIWQRLEQNRIHRTEDSSAGADAERQREDGNQSEAGLLQQHSYAITQVLKHFILHSERLQPERIPKSA